MNAAEGTDWNHSMRNVDDSKDTATLRSLRYLTDAIRVQRFHSCVPIVVKQTTGEHTAEVAMICDLLVPGGASAPLLRRALRHDLPELTWGDMPGPAKRLIGERLAAVEDETMHRVHLLETTEGAGVMSGGTLTSEENRTLEMADRISGALHCVYCRSLGSKRANLVYDRYRGWLDEHKPWTAPEAAMLAALDQLWKEALWV
jgi:alkylhydroperoxidase family enzyme